MRKEEEECIKKFETFRSFLIKKNWDAFLIRCTDGFLNEFIHPYSGRVQWLTNFRGSSGVMIVTKDSIKLFVDGRYLTQAYDQACTKTTQVIDIGLQRPSEWLIKNLSQNVTIAIVSNLHSVVQAEYYLEIAKKYNWKLEFIPSTLIDKLWKEQPRIPKNPIVAYPYSDVSFQEKCNSIFSKAFLKNKLWLLFNNAEIAWLTNTRGSDIPFSPLYQAYAILYKNEDIYQCDIFLNQPRKSRDILGNKPLDNIYFYQRKDFSSRLNFLCSDKTIFYDPHQTPYASLQKASGLNLKKESSPFSLAKSIKTPFEIEGMKEIHIKDSIAFVQLLYWLSHIPLDKTITELCITKKLESLRMNFSDYKGQSFETISAWGPNSAMVHYHPSSNANSTLTEGIYLIDAGGHYLRGTTDTTRTILLGKREASATEKLHFTTVLKSHIDLAKCHFPKGTRGIHLDTIARLPLWDIEENFPHSTGHGVGNYLTVHEAPPSLSQRDDGVALQEGMIFSNEPGYYRENEYGIRIENLVYVKACEKKSDFLYLENLTLVPIDKKLIATELLSSAQKAWLDTYHQHVYDKIHHFLSPNVRDWLYAATRP